ncbi:hypothetical protein FSP39_015758 [Pinctada imbricata]|uniref:THAP-type domain-containing protein n=1 Tax=Pinctada imbricata TaxID=66713 RepID=A0AA88YCZ6_PINIB|nr:hypothetical protein FSP39_015758 [Pinctada imbricata]
MVLRCAWGTCNGDERYPERQGPDGRLILFPKPKTEPEKCLRWIKACGRPHEQLNINKKNKHKAVCSKHFVGGKGPTELFPDPIQADGSTIKPSRQKPKRSVEDDKDDFNDECEKPNTAAVQTEERWISGMDMFILAAENHELKGEIEDKKKEISILQKQLKDAKDEIDKNKMLPTFGVEIVLGKEEKIKGLFKYYTGITYIRFQTLLLFLFPIGSKIEYEKGRKDLKAFSQADALFLTICRLRYNFGLKDIAMRFQLSLQSAGVVFNTWIKHMYLKLGQLCIWPHRDVIINNMPKEFKQDYPNTIIIIDGTEFKTQTPCALGLQSQLYSDYKSSTTLKALVGCDPNGSVTFISELFTGSISDKAITEQSGFYDVILSLKSKGYINDGDAVMADKGFTIKDELAEFGIALNIPPHASSGKQMSVSDTILTQEIAKHRVHIERLIAKIKTYKIISDCIPTSLFQNINKIWSVCSYLTLFQDVFVKD